MAQINDMKDNYKKLDDIATDIRNSEIEKVLKFDSQDRYGFFHCETCGGPILGHLEPKCRRLNGVRYDNQTVKSFEDWLERIAEFRQAIADRERKKEEKQAELQATKLGQAMRLIIENVEHRNPTTPMTQLVKSRWPLLWTGQQFDKWKLEVI